MDNIRDMDTEISNLRLMTSLHFDKIINGIDVSAETLIADPHLDESAKAKICQIREEFIDIIKNIETLNLNNFKSDPTSYTNKMFQLLKQMNDGVFESDHLIELLLKKNCFFIEYKYLKNNKSKHLIGILVLVDWYLTAKKLQSFKCLCETFNETDLFSFDPFETTKTEERIQFEFIDNSLLNKELLIEKKVLFELSKKINEANQHEDIISMKLFEARELDLRHVFFQKIEMDTFSFVSQLISLDLSENYLKDEALIVGLFEPLKNLEIFNMSGNEFTKIPEFLFQDLSNLKNLELQMNSIEYLARNSFCGLLKLSYLNLSGNKLIKLEPLVFRGLKCLKTVCLENQTKFTPDVKFKRTCGIFEGLDRLESLEIGSNSFEIRINSNNRFFKGLASLKCLDLTHACFESVDFDEFDELTNLEELNMSQCELKVFEYVCPKSLKILNLSGNNLEFLTEKSFRNLPKLERLSLNQNKLKNLGESCFSSLLSLKYLELDENLLTSLNEKTFLGINNLEKILLNDNQIFSIDKNSFIMFSKLETLDLSKNSLVSLCESLFDNLIVIKFLFLNKNHLRSIEKNMFRNNSYLEILNLNQNSINFLNNTTFDNITRLKKLYIGGNELEYIDKDLFKNLSELEELCIYHNKIKIIEDYSFRNLNKLVSLKIHDNQISSLKRHTFVGLFNLKELLKYNNPINYIEKGAFNFNKI